MFEVTGKRLEKMNGFKATPDSLPRSSQQKQRRWKPMPISVAGNRAGSPGGRHVVDSSPGHLQLRAWGPAQVDAQHSNTSLFTARFQWFQVRRGWAFKNKQIKRANMP